MIVFTKAFGPYFSLHGFDAAGFHHFFVVLSLLVFVFFFEMFQIFENLKGGSS